ncbi:MAG: SDR family oxidoreductase [Terrimicrobiaceae bacterium]|nr:SDR family oxidoreductase [Terrimicrobiaceae bacterium]
MRSEFDGAVVIVTGGTSGIGRAVAEAFGRERAIVGILGRDAVRAAEVVEAVGRSGGRAESLIADLRDPQAVERVLEEFCGRNGTLRAAVNTAGIDREGGVFDATLPDFEETFDVNVRGLWVCMKAEIAAMRKAGQGAIVNVTSISARLETPANALYSASKAAASMLTRCAALEEGPRGIRVNELSPGPVDTPMLRGFFEKARAKGVHTGPEDLARVSPLRRIGQPGEMADIALFLCSEKAAYINGACLTADGGISLGMRVG